MRNFYVLFHFQQQQCGKRANNCERFVSFVIENCFYFYNFDTSSWCIMAFNCATGATLCKYVSVVCSLFINLIVPKQVNVLKWYAISDLLIIFQMKNWPKKSRYKFYFSFIWWDDRYNFHLYSIDGDSTPFNWSLFSRWAFWHFHFNANSWCYLHIYWILACL